MFTKTAAFYDAIYQWKNYALESEKLHKLIQKHKRSSANTLLDVACGTGMHLQFLSRNYEASGLDIDEEMVKVARQRCPKIVFHQGDMLTFDLKRRFDIVTCLFSSIGCVKTLENLQRAIANMTRYLQPGGVLVIEPWFTLEQWKPGSVHSIFVDQPEFKIARMNVSKTQGRLAILEMHYLVGTPQGVNHCTECHEMGLFAHDEYLDAFRQARLDVLHDPEGLMGRGIYLGLHSR